MDSRVPTDSLGVYIFFVIFKKVLQIIFKFFYVILTFTQILVVGLWQGIFR